MNPKCDYLGTTTQKPKTKTHTYICRDTKNIKGDKYGDDSECEKEEEAFKERNDDWEFTLEVKIPWGEGSGV